MKERKSQVSFSSILDTPAQHPVVKSDDVKKFAVVIDGADIYKVCDSEVEAIQIAEDLAKSRDFADSVMTVHAVKAQAAQESDDFTEAEAADRGVKTRGPKVVDDKEKTAKFIVPAESRAFPLQDQPSRTGPQIADDSGESALGMSYSEELYQTLSGNRSKTYGTVAPIPEAGNLVNEVGDTRSTGSAGFKPLADAPAMLGGATKEMVSGLGESVRGPYLFVEGKPVAVRVGENWLPAGGSDLAPAAGASFPDAKEPTEKRAPRPKGFFAKIQGSNLLDR